MMLNPDAAFARAQREYENRMPPKADEITLDRQCGSTVERKMVTPEMEKLFVMLADGEPFRTAAVRGLLHEWKVADSGEFVCSFDGEVDAAAWQGTVEWTCPVCGDEHVDQYEDERP